ncbi:MAG: Gldg family protein, partial [Vicinamibacterales bacterium]
MERSFRSGVIFFVGVAVLATGLAIHAILLEPALWTNLVIAAGVVLTLWGAYALRDELVTFFQRRRGEIALATVGILGVLVALMWLSVRFPARLDMTEAGHFSLSPETTRMLERIDRPVHITFFHDPMMRETVELYELMASKNPRITVDFFDPMVNPAQARMMGVQFAGTAVMESEGRKLQVNGPGEADIANGILRVSRASTQQICFTDGHNEPDPFSMESHDHMEGGAGHSHGLGGKLVIHERHGMARARNALEAMNYTVRKVTLASSSSTLEGCSVLVVAGPQTPMLPREVEAIRQYIEGGGNAMLMLDPFVDTGLEPVVRELGVVLDNDMVIDPASHFWADPSAPAVSQYNRHHITRDLPLTFFPGARSLSPTPERVPRTYGMPIVNS